VVATDNPIDSITIAYRNCGAAIRERMMCSPEIWFHAQIVNISGFASFRIPLQGRHDAQ
jgi:hypothetical protein